MKHLIKPLFPLKYHTKYRTPESKFVAIWRQWFGRVLWAEHYQLAA